MFRPGWLFGTPDARAGKFESLGRINSIRETNGSFGSRQNSRLDSKTIYFFT